MLYTIEYIQKIKSYKMEKKLQVLIIDDDAGVTKTFTSQLQKLNYKVTCYSNPHDVLDMIRNAKANYFDVIILDYYLNDTINGIDLLDEFKKNEKFSDIPVIMMSSNDDLDLVQTSFSHGVTIYIVKDLRNPPSYLDAKIQAALSIKKIDNNIKKIFGE